MIELFFTAGLILLVVGVIFDILAFLLLRGLSRFTFFLLSILFLFAALAHFSVVAQEIGLTEVDPATGQPTLRGRVMFNALAWGLIYVCYALLMLNISFAVHTVLMAVT